MTTTWTTKDGQEIPITELSDKHLSNILAMLERQAKQAVRQIQLAKIPRKKALLSMLLENERRDG